MASPLADGDNRHPGGGEPTRERVAKAVWGESLRQIGQHPVVPERPREVAPVSREATISRKHQGRVILVGASAASRHEKVVGRRRDRRHAPVGVLGLEVPCTSSW